MTTLFREISRGSVILGSALLFGFSTTGVTVVVAVVFAVGDIAVVSTLGLFPLLARLISCCC